MKILTVTNMYPSDSCPYFGVFVKEIVDGIKSRGIHVDLVNIIPPKSGGSYLSYFNCFVILIFKRILNSYDVVYCHHAFCVFLCKILFFKNIVYTNHEGEFFKRSLIERVKDNAVRVSNVTIFVNKNMADHYTRLYPGGNYVFQPCGLDLEKFPLVSMEEAKEILGLNLSVKYIFFPADPKRKEKNFSLLNDVYCSNYQYFNEISCEIVTGGSIPYDEMYLYYHACDVVVSCSKYESDGMVYKESLCCNRPFLSTDVGNARFYASLGNGVIYTDSKSLFKSLKCFLGTKQNDEQSRRASFDEYFSIDKYLDRVITIFKSN